MDYWKIKLILFCSLLLFPFPVFSQYTYPVCSPFAQFYKRDSINIITFGASTVQGVPAPFNFQTPLKLFLENCYTGKTVIITNNGIAGQTTSDGILRFDAAITDKTGFVIILMGANDAIRIVDGKSNVAATVNNMRQMVDKALAAKLGPILGTIQFFDQTAGDNRTRQLSRQRNIIINQINNAYRNLARQKGIRLADLNATLGRNPQLYSDFIHPNARGYEVMSYVWFDAINQEIEQNFLNDGAIQNYPNPAKNYSRIGYTVAKAGMVQIKITDMMGRPVYHNLSVFWNAGYHEEEIDTSVLQPGLYIISVTIGTKYFSKKMMVTR